MAERVRDVLVANGAEHVMVFCGDDGLDELTTTTTSHVYEHKHGTNIDYVLDPLSFGIGRADHDALRGADAAHNASIAGNVLSGKPGATRDIVVLNAAAALQVAGIVDDWVDGVAAACAAIDDGTSVATLQRWRETASLAQENHTAAHGSAHADGQSGGHSGPGSAGHSGSGNSRSGNSRSGNSRSGNAL